ncbi:MAG: DUF167 domain-containing protein [Candidatus Gracilibacteria bacterium]|nr:DUF167 domain-containing protein [Candidatus Gracilibacteria bacterium]MDD5179016.1 DUF167 domain-containing protein [Candidatus Gracilibacteria bacterium]
MKTLNELFAEFEKVGRITLRVKVIPKSAANAIVGLMDNETLKVRIAAVAEKGKANHELINFFAEEFQTGKDKITIITGAADTLKLVRIER